MVVSEDGHDQAVRSEAGEDGGDEVGGVRVQILVLVEGDHERDDRAEFVDNGDDDGDAEDLIEGQAEAERLRDLVGDGVALLVLELIEHDAEGEDA